MRKKIQNYLSQLEQEKNIRILLACETGSRAWGFPSPDSDFDVRIVYVHKKDWYLNLSEQKDTIDVFYENNDIDISGWDLKKSLKLLLKSNAALLERIQSPIIYKSDDKFVKDILTLSQECYSKIGTMHHYLSMAKKCVEEVEEKSTYKLKKFFYALRASVATKWILDRNEIPPIEFVIMLDQLDIEPNIVSRVKELIELKSEISEQYMHEGDSMIIEFMKECIMLADKKFKDLPRGNGKMENLNTFFLNILNS